MIRAFSLRDSHSSEVRSSALAPLLLRAHRIVCPVAIVAAALAYSWPAPAKDYGQVGTVFPVVEQDLLRVIETRLKTMQADGRLEAFNQRMKANTEAKVLRPPPVPGIGVATATRSWLFDPSIVIDHDIRDTKGNFIAHRGQRVNPLDFIVVSTPLVFIYGDDEAQLAWALKKFGQNAKLIMVRGSPLDAMSKHQRRFYFDQSGILVRRFGIQAVPALVVQEGKAMRVSEIVPGRNS